MKIVYLGSGEFGLDCLNGLLQSPNGVEFVITQPSQPAGRGQKERPTPVAKWAKDNSVPFVETADVNSAEVVKKIAALEPELLVVIAFGQKIGKEITAIPCRGAINVHSSLLPKYRGAAPINWAIINGEKETGVSVITVAEKMDAGNILSQATTAIGQDETAGELHDRLAKISVPLLLGTIEKIADGSAVYTPQDDSKATMARKLKKSDGFLDFSEPAEILRRKILGLWPWPGASAIYKAQKTGKSLRAAIADAVVITKTNAAGVVPGTLDDELNVICGTDALRITKIKPSGAEVMAFRDFVNGRHTCPGDMFAKVEQ